MSAGLIRNAAQRRLIVLLLNIQIKIILIQFTHVLQYDCAQQLSNPAWSRFEHRRNTSVAMNRNYSETSQISIPADKVPLNRSNYKCISLYVILLFCCSAGGLNPAVLKVETYVNPTTKNCCSSAFVHLLGGKKEGIGPLSFLSKLLVGIIIFDLWRECRRREKVQSFPFESCI